MRAMIASTAKRPVMYQPGLGWGLDKAPCSVQWPTRVRHSDAVLQTTRQVPQPWREALAGLTHYRGTSIKSEHEPGLTAIRDI